MRNFLQRLELISIFLVIESCRNCEPHFLDEDLHIIAILRSAPGGKAKRPRSLGIGEIVDIAPVARRTFFGRQFLGKILRQPVSVAAVRAQYEQVVTIAVHANAELDGVDRTLLSEVGFSGW